MTWMLVKSRFYGVSQGFSLIEVLISVLIIAIGLLGVAKLNMMNLQKGSMAYHLEVATNLAMEMSERIKANRQGVINLYYDSPSNAMSAACYSSGCTPQEMANTDFYEWRNKLANSLPGGVGNVCVDSNGTSNCNGDSFTNDITYAITVSWNDNGQARTITTPVRVLP